MYNLDSCSTKMAIFSYNGWFILIIQLMDKKGTIKLIKRIAVLINYKNELTIIFYNLIITLFSSVFNFYNDTLVLFFTI